VFRYSTYVSSVQIDLLPSIFYMILPAIRLINLTKSNTVGWKLAFENCIDLAKYYNILENFQEGAHKKYS